MPWYEEETKQPDITELICPVCKTDDIVLPGGDEESKVLMVGEFPGKEEILHGKPFVGPTGRVLKEELRRGEFPSLFSFRLCNLWIHEPNKNNDCFEYGIRTVINEARNKSLIVLIGSDAVKYFTGLNVSEWNGLLVTSTLLTCEKILAMIQPATVFKNTVGEFRFAMNRFKHHLGELE